MRGCRPFYRWRSHQNPEPNSGRDPALRWQLQHGRSAIPKSTNPDRIAENLDVFDFVLTGEQMGRIDSLDAGVRNGPDPDVPRPAMFDRVIPEQ